jgi:hypothetical protein
VRHRKLVAAQPRDRVGALDAPAQALCDDREQLVAGGVAEAVVDNFEVVDIDEHYRQRGLAVVGTLDRGFDALGEQRPVRQTRERIREGQLFEPADQSAQVADHAAQRDSKAVGFRFGVYVATQVATGYRVGEPGHAALVHHHIGERFGHLAQLIA